MRARGLCYRRGVRRALGRLEIGNLQLARSDTISIEKLLGLFNFQNFDH